MVWSGGSDIFIGVCQKIWYVLYSLVSGLSLHETIAILLGFYYELRKWNVLDSLFVCFLFFFPFGLSRAATKAFAHHWMECVCEQEEARLWRCSAVSQVYESFGSRNSGCPYSWFSYNVYNRGDDGELRLGIRRAAQVKGCATYPTLCSQQLNYNTITDVVNAISMKNAFNIFYNPR